MVGEDQSWTQRKELPGVNTIPDTVSFPLLERNGIGQGEYSSLTSTIFQYTVQSLFEKIEIVSIDSPIRSLFTES